jgi:transcription antitermination factor NusG
MESQSERQWLALRVKSRCEKLVASAGESKGFEVFLPVYQCRRKWSDRSKTVELPLFPGYVFYRLSPENRLPLLKIPGAVHFVGIGKTVAAIDDREIAAIRAAIRAKLTVEPWPFLDAGTRIRLEAGPLAGVEGILIQDDPAARQNARIDENRVVVSVGVLRRSVAVGVEKQWIGTDENGLKLGVGAGANGPVKSANG